MLLYIIAHQDSTLAAQPLIAPDLQTAVTSLSQLNPENLYTLQIVPLLYFNSISDLISLFKELNFTGDPEDDKNYLPYQFTRSGDSSPIADPTTEGR